MIHSPPSNDLLPGCLPPSPVTSDKPYSNGNNSPKVTEGGTVTLGGCNLSGKSGSVGMLLGEQMVTR